MTKIYQTKLSFELGSCRTQNKWTCKMYHNKTHEIWKWTKNENFLKKYAAL